jgi:DNA repair protein RecO (recombination protein O)
MADRSRVYRTHAIVLRRRDYGDADRILTIFTPEKGRIEVIAKGVRKTSSRKAGHLEPFAHTNLQLAEARTWDIVTEAVTVEAFRHLREDLDAIGRAGYIAEMIESFGEGEDDHRLLWELTTGALRDLDEIAAGTQSADRNVHLAWFMLHLLSITGFQPQLHFCLGCDEEIQPVTNFLHLQEGGVYCPNCAAQFGAQGNDSRSALAHGLEAIEPDVLKVLRYLQRTPWSEARRLTVRPANMRRVENILHRYIMLVLERQLRSVDFLRRMQNDERFKA